VLIADCTLTMPQSQRLRTDRLKHVRDCPCARTKISEEINQLELQTKPNRYTVSYHRNKSFWRMGNRRRNLLMSYADFYFVEQISIDFLGKCTLQPRRMWIEKQVCGH